MSEAIGVLLTFTTYGTHIPGADVGSVRRQQSSWGAPTIPPSAAWQDQAQRLMVGPEFTLSPQDRALVLKSVIDACAHRAWHLFCIHVRTNHVHVVLQTDVPIDRAMIYLKARATFALKAHYPDCERFWTKRGSTRYLWNRTSLAASIDYVMNQQGAPMKSWTSGSIL